MSLSSSLNFAVAGLDITSRRAEVVAQNVANADRAGYARRTVTAGGAGNGLPGAGVAIARDIDPRLVSLRREAQSREAGQSALQTFNANLDAAIGDPDEPGGLQDSLARLDAAFVSAATDPASPTRLTEISRAADGLATRLNALATVVDRGRQDADADIGKAVEQLNTDLREVARLNVDILRLNTGGHDSADLTDRRTVLVDRISQQIPVRELPRDNGVIALVSSSGTLLLDGLPAQLGFSARAPITPDMEAPTHLSGLTVNGRDLPTSGPTSGIPGGKLAALFEIRDVVAPRATKRLDGLAGDMMLRFEATGVDASGVGLFGDRGAPYDATAPAGLAGRIGVNALVSPDRLDQHWRLRDGLAATAKGSGADNSLLLRYGTALATSGSPLAGGLPDIPSDLPGHAAALRSLISADRVRSDDLVESSRIEAQSLADRRDGGAVDIDTEMRRLIEIEQAYAANARVIQVVGDMINRLTEL